MNKNLSSYYLDIIKKKLRNLDNIKDQYNAELFQQNKLMEENKLTIENFKISNNTLKEQYDSLKNIIQRQGVIFQIRLEPEYEINQWENLFLVKVSKGYEIQNKSGKVLTMLDEAFVEVIEDINRDSYSLIVIRISNKIALVQLRFI